MADLVSGIAVNLLEKLGSLAYKEISSAWGMEDDLKKLEQTTSILEAVLLDAEKKQEHNKQLEFWLIRLKDVFQDAQDVLDEFECEVLRSKVVKEYGSLGRKVRRFFSSSNPLAFRFGIAHHSKDVRQKLEEISTEMNKFNLVSIQLSPEQRHLMQGRREMTHSFVNASDVIGRDADKEKIIDMLMDKYHIGDDKISVLPILVGIGGLGKTTLAKLVYNDEKVVDKFDLRMWVCVSLDFNVTNLVREILKSALKAMKKEQDKDINNWSIDLLQTSLRDILSDKKFLLVLDDVWNTDRSKWNELRDFLTVGAEGSKLIVTTRNTSVASVMSTTSPHRLEGLSMDDCLSLFFKCAFGDEKIAEQNPQLKGLGVEIVKKCGGVPLALKTLGSLLYSKTEAEWKFVRDNEIWELEGDQGQILPALRISYDTMSACLKQCFSYCSTFPEDSKIISFELIRIWMALGIFQSPNNKMELENIGESHFMELCSRSFFEREDDEENFYGLFCEFGVHDLIHNLACLIAQHECCIINSNCARISDSVRHVRINLNENDLTIFQKVRKVRSIHIDFSSDVDHKPDILHSFISKCISRFKHLRVFDLSKLSFDVLPNSIGNLRHLRYLDLCFNDQIKKLPDSICKLQSLETLFLQGCEELEELPRDIRMLVSLRTLFVTTKQTGFPDNGVGRLKSLRFIAIIGCKNLRCLPSDMGYCTTLRTLLIVNCRQLELASEPLNETVHLSLQKLVINDLPKTTVLPSWLQGAAKTLEILHIESCPKLAALPEWLPNLTSLQKIVIKWCDQLSYLPEGMQRLTSLTHLTIKYCDALEERCKREVGQDWPKIAHVPNKFIGFDLSDESDQDSQEQ